MRMKMVARASRIFSVLGAKRTDSSSNLGVTISSALVHSDALRRRVSALSVRRLLGYLR